MQKLTYSFATAFAAMAVLLATPAAQAQTTASTAASTEEVASISLPNTRVTESPAEAVRNLSAPAEFTTDAYYDDSHKDLKQTLAWMQETNAMHPAYHTMYAEARIRLQLKDYSGAHSTAVEAKKMAVAAADGDYVRRSEEVITKAKARIK